MSKNVTGTCHLSSDSMRNLNNSPTSFGRGVFNSILKECVATYKENGHQDCGPVDVVTRILVF